LQRTTSDQLIQSPDNEVVRRLRRLGVRRRPDEVLIEGPRPIAEAIHAGLGLELLAVREGDDFDLPAKRRVTLSRGLFRALSQTDTPQGVLAVARIEAAPLAAVRQRAVEKGWPLVVLDGIQDPGNVGAISRTAAAAGAPSLVVLPDTADPYGPKSVRASAGFVFRLAVAGARWADLEDLSGLGAAAAGGTPLDQAPLESADMIVLGSETHGLSHRGLPLVSIPMAEGIDSLNVAAAAAILLFEVRRRRAG
jgi:TrmH family RNA methyltransferase